MLQRLKIVITLLTLVISLTIAGGHFVSSLAPGQVLGENTGQSFFGTVWDKFLRLLGLRTSQPGEPIRSLEYVPGRLKFTSPPADSTPLPSPSPKLASPTPSTRNNLPPLPPTPSTRGVKRQLTAFEKVDQYFGGIFNSILGK